MTASWSLPAVGHWHWIHQTVRIPCLTVDDPNRKVPDLYFKVVDPKLQVAGLNAKMGELRSGGIPPNLTADCENRYCICGSSPLFGRTPTPRRCFSVQEHPTIIKWKHGWANRDDKCRAAGSGLWEGDNDLVYLLYTPFSDNRTYCGCCCCCVYLPLSSISSLHSRRQLYPGIRPLHAVASQHCFSSYGYLHSSFYTLFILPSSPSTASS